MKKIWLNAGFQGIEAGLGFEWDNPKTPTVSNNTPVQEIIGSNGPDWTKETNGKRLRDALDHID